MPAGRPPKGDDEKPMKFVGFLATTDTAAAIDKLVAAASRPGALVNKSDVIRRAIEEAASRLGVARAQAEAHAAEAPASSEPPSSPQPGPSLKARRPKK